jgi:hypothetical protein
MEVREDFSAYLDGEMSAEARAQIEAHLGVCADCLRELDTLKRVDDSYQKLERIAAPAGFEAGVREAVRSGRMPSAAGHRPVPRWMGPIVAMAAAAAVLIVGVLVLESRQTAPAGIQLASAPAETKESATPLSEAAAAAKRAETDSPAGAAGGAGWDDFVRTPARGGREDGGEALAQGLAAADDKAEGQRSNAGRAADVERAEAEVRARAEVIGTPPAAAPVPQTAAAPEMVLEAPTAHDAPKTGAGQAPPIGAGEVVSRQTLRSFRVGADGIWYERGYDNQPRTALKRESAPLRELMKSHSGEEWGKLLGHVARQVFEIDGAWYELEAAPQETK